MNVWLSSRSGNETRGSTMNHQDPITTMGILETPFSNQESEFGTDKTRESRQIHKKEQRPLLMGTLHNNERSRKQLIWEHMDTEARPNKNGLTKVLPQNEDIPHKPVDRPMMEKILWGILQNKIILSKADSNSELNQKLDKVTKKTNKEETHKKQPDKARTERQV